MKASLICASAALLAAEATLAKPTATTTTLNARAPSCTAELLAEYCDYPKPPGTGVFNIATDGKAGCWEYCAKNQPCDFVVWLEANEELDIGTCWVYPGLSYDASAGSSDGCSRKAYKVYGKPACTGLAPPQPIGTNTAAVLPCAATASPSPVAQICGYPTPKDDCWDSCSASSSSSACLSQCAQRGDECAFAIFNPRNSILSPHSSGTCWMFPEGETYNPAAAGTCEGAVEQYVYENKCPKPPKPSSTSAPAASSSPSAGAGEDSSSGSGSGGGASPSAGSGSEGSGNAGAAGVAGAAQSSPTPAEPGKAAAGSVRASVGSLALGGAAALLWQVLA